MNTVVTLATGSIGFLKGAAVQALALQRIHPEVKHITMVENNHYKKCALDFLEKSGTEILTLPRIRPPKKVKYVAARWEYTFSKLHIWNLTQYPSIVFLDADCLPVQPFIDVLTNFQEHSLIAAQVNRKSIGRFNSGVMGIIPDRNTYKELLDYLNSMPDLLKNSDQSLLNSYFHGKHQTVSLRYNQRQWLRYGDTCAIAHLRPKPWETKRPNKFAKKHYNTWNKLLLSLG